MTVDPIPAFEAAPLSALRPSARIDLIHLLAVDKPCIRLRSTTSDGVALLQQWAQQLGLFALADDLDPGYVFLAHEQEVAFRARAIDQSTKPHAYELGQCLGYPACCCDAVATVGEEAIDDYAERAAGWEYSGLYRLIDPAKYREGSALICHIPCSPKCEATLKIAQRVWEVIGPHVSLPSFAPWAEWSNHTSDSGRETSCHAASSSTNANTS